MRPRRLCHDRAPRRAGATGDGQLSASVGRLGAHARLLDAAGAGDDELPATWAERSWVRLATFAALAGYGVERWATLLRPAPAWRLLGLLAVAVALAGGVPLLARLHRLLAAVVAFVLVMVAFPMAGLRWHWFTHVRIAASAARIDHGLQALPNVLVPYLGTNHAVRLVIMLGAAVLLLDAAAVLASAGRAGSAFGDGRRAAAALPLTALAVVPGTLIRPEFPYLQGLLLFGLLAAFMWGERLRRPAAGAAVGIVALAGVAGAIAAARIDQGSPWVDYRAWAGATARAHVDMFNWNQTYGPLRWPHSGHQVLAVQAAHKDYWKAEDLDDFNGYSWVQGGFGIQPVLPSPDPSALAKWTQTIQVSITGMQTDDVIAAGYASAPSPSTGGGFGEGTDPGTWVSGRTLGPGTSYQLVTYSPHPSAHQLQTAGRAYPVQPLSNDLTLSIPTSAGGPRAVTAVTFPGFHAGPRRATESADSLSAGGLAGLMERSPYGGAYALARRLAAEARTPYQFVMDVKRYLSLPGFTYDETPPLRQYPLESFLFTDRQGYCQQFSGAMAMLLRMGGVPARVAAGFTPGAYDARARRWIVTDIDAHAWVEAWFPHYGWVRFDPTPATAPARGGAAAPPLLKSLKGLGQSITTPHREIGSAGVTTTAASHPTGSGPSAWLLALAIALAAAAALGVAGLRRGHRAREDPIGELERALSRTRRPISHDVTLAGLETRLHSSPEAAAYVRGLRLVRYGGSSRTPTAAQRRALRRELARGLGIAGRLRALWALPPRI